MPIYEYQCQSCSRVSEEWQKFSDSPLTTCSHCGGELTKLISQSAFHLKGGGWYVSEYGRSNTAGAKNAEAKPEKSETAESPKKTETAGAVSPKSDA